MSMPWTLVACIFFLVLCIGDLVNHNKTVEQLFPDNDDPRNPERRLRLTVHFTGHIIVIILLVAALWKAIFGS